MVRTVTLPINAAADWATLAWPTKYAGDSLPHTLDCAAWLADGGLTLSAAIVTLASPGLILGDPALVGSPATSVVLTIGGGAAGATASVVLQLSVGTGLYKEVQVSLPIAADLAGLSPPAGDTAPTIVTLLL